MMSFQKNINDIVIDFDFDWKMCFLDEMNNGLNFILKKIIFIIESID